MPTHSYMSPEPLQAPLAHGVRAARIDADKVRGPADSSRLLRIGEIGLVSFTAAAGVWCLYEAVRFFIG